MQLFLGLRGSWKCIEVQLLNGCVPCISNTAMRDQHIEPAVWFKVLVLESVCVDCDERVISWSVNGHLSSSVAKRITIDPPTPCSCTLSDKSNSSQYVHTDSQDSVSSSMVSSLSLFLGSTSPCHSLMAPHNGTEARSLGSDDLHSLFELSEMLFRFNKSESDCNSRSQHVEHRSWLKLLHCYLLPLIPLHNDDIIAVETALTEHSSVLAQLDQKMVDMSTKRLHLKQDLSSLISQLLPCVGEWARSAWCDRSFLSLVISDLKLREEEARMKIHSSIKNLDLSGRLSMPVSASLEQKFIDQQREGEVVLVETLRLRSALEEVLSLSEGVDERCLNEGHRSLDEGVAGDRCLDEGADGDRSMCDSWKLQQKYSHLHEALSDSRVQSAALSSEKVLALSVREALEQTLASLSVGRSTTGLDVGLAGGHSTDVLQEAVQCESTNDFMTLREKVQKLLQLQTTEVAQIHNSFCAQLKTNWFANVDLNSELNHSPVDQRHRAMTQPLSRSMEPKLERRWTLHSKKKAQTNSSSPAKQPDILALAQLVKRHFEKMVESLSCHFTVSEVEFQQRVWLCYERIFFEAFASNIFALYKVHYKKYCHQLMLNAVSVSIVEPQSLDLGIADSSWLDLFPQRPFETVVNFYQCVTDEASKDKGCTRVSSTQTIAGTTHSSQDFLDYFGGVTSDLSSLPLAISPLDQLQLLTSAFRKAMTGLSKLKLQPVMTEQVEQVDLTLGVVNCDDLLPVLVLILLQLEPNILADLHLHCTMLAEYMAPFLCPGWHGYSLAIFTSALHIISKL